MNVPQIRNSFCLFVLASPKRSRRDGKTETERPSANSHLDNRNHSDRDQNHHRRLKDALPLEAPSEQDSKVEGVALSKGKSEKANLDNEGTKISSDPTDVPRSRSYFQVLCLVMNLSSHTSYSVF